MSKKRNIKIKSKILVIILFITVIPMFTVTYFFSENFFGFLNEQSEEYYLTLMEQVSININYELDKYKKIIDELLLDGDFRRLFFAYQYFTAIEEIRYDNELGNAVRNNLINNIEGDINIIQFDRKSILENKDIKSGSYSLGQYRIDTDRLLVDPLFLYLKENPDTDFLIGSFNKDVIIGFDSDKKSVIVYAVRDDRKNINKLIVVILQTNYFLNLYSHLNKLQFGTLFISDFKGNLLSLNHPSIYDYFDYDRVNRVYIQGNSVKEVNDNKMTLDDYNKLVLDPAVLNYPDILEFLVDSGLETPFLKGTKTGKKNIVINYNNNSYYTVGRVDVRTNMKYVFMIPLYHVTKPVRDFFRLIVILSTSLLAGLIILLVVINMIFLSPLEKAYVGLEEKNLHFMNLAHETKTPLTLIKNYLDRYIEKTELTDELKVIKQNIYKLERDMVNILDSRKLEQGKVIYNMNKDYSFSDFLRMKEKLYKEAALKKNIEIVFDIKDNMIIKTDPLALDRIVNNLVDNAIKYTPEGGSVRVILSEQKDKVEFQVIDSGVGISNENIKKLFKPYSQIFNPLGSSKGVGLGLYITHCVVKEMKGVLTVNSTLGKGSVFSVKFKQVKSPTSVEAINPSDISRIPLVSESIHSVKSDKQEFISGRKTILVLEDNPDLLFYITTELEKDYNVFSAENGNIGLEILPEIKKPDLILSDIMMPEMDGFNFLEFIHNNQKYNDIPLIFLSASSGNDEKIKAFHGGAVDFISKPFSIELLKARIESLINFQILKKELYEKDKYASLGMLLGGISHEIFNPLLGIYAPLENLEVLIEKSENKLNIEKGMRFISNINESVNRIENIVKSLKILYYNRDLNTEDLNVNEIIQSIVQIFNKKISDKIKIEFSVDDGFTVKGNHSSLTQILINLISNSIDAIGDCGYVEIKAVSSKKGNYILVSDNGHGIEEEDLGNIFNAFFTTKEVGKGTGLGLYIVKDLAIRMGWELEVSSKVNVGTTFKIIF